MSRFQLIPKPDKDWFAHMERLMVNHVWEQGRHHISKDKMIASKQEGGFNMLDIRLQNKSLKLRWVDRLLSDRVEISFGSVYVMDAFVIPIIDLLRCNIHPRRFKKLLRVPLPPVWMEIFETWFEYQYIPADCSDPAKTTDLLNSLLCFNESVSKTIARFGGEYDELTTYTMLGQHDIFTWADFLFSFNNFANLKYVNPRFTMLLVTIKAFMPQQWQVLFNNVLPQNHTTKLHLVHHCLEGRMSVKSWYNLLCSAKCKINNTAISKWVADLDMPDILDKWTTICSKQLAIKNPKLQDFSRSFLHRSYHLNSVIASYRTDFSPNCTFCDKEKETVLHLYWECEHTKDIWNKVKTFVFENISEDVNMSCYSCLLSDFDLRVLVLLSTIVKFRIFIAHLNNRKISYIQILRDLHWDRDTHLDRTDAENLTPYYQFWGTLISDSLFDNEYKRYTEEQ